MEKQLKLLPHVLAISFPLEEVFDTTVACPLVDDALDNELRGAGVGVVGARATGAVILRVLRGLLLGHCRCGFLLWMLVVNRRVAWLLCCSLFVVCV